MMPPRLLRARVWFQPPTGEEVDENLCLDAGYVGTEQLVTRFGYQPHIRPRREEQAPNPTFPPRRWIVELFHSWLRRQRKILIRHEKRLVNYHGLIALAAALIIQQKIINVV